MHFHFCGDVVHDLVHNSLMLLVLAVDYVPWVPTWKQWAHEQLRAEHKKHDHGEHQCPLSSTTQ